MEEDSILRISVIRCKEGEYRIYMCFHHIIMDGWCMSLLMNDIAQLYGQMLEGKEDQVILANMECVTGYEKYVRNQKKKDLKEGLKYWNEVLEGYEKQAMIKPEGIAEPTEEEVSIVTRRISKEIHRNVGTNKTGTWNYYKYGYRSCLGNTTAEV